MGETVIPQLIEVSLSVFILAAIVWYGLKQFNRQQDSHKEEREQLTKAHAEALAKKDEEHREERREKDAKILSQEEFIRNLTKDTYDVMAQMTAKLDTIGMRTKEEREEIRMIILTAKQEANQKVIAKLDIIARKMGIDDVGFYR